MDGIFDASAWKQEWSSAVERLATTAANLLPTVLGVLLILALGWVVAKTIELILRRTLNRLGLDRATEQLRIAEGLRRANITALPSRIVARVFFWVLMLTFLLAAVEKLGLTAVTVTIDRLVAYLPNVAAAALIAVLGLLVGRLAGSLVGSAAALANLTQASRLGAAAHALVVLVVLVVAVEQLGVETDVLVTVITALVATFGVTMGVTFALGAQPVVSHILAGHYLRQSLPAGKTVEACGRRGAVENIGAVETLFRAEDVSWSVPNATLLNEVITR